MTCILPCYTTTCSERFKMCILYYHIEIKGSRCSYDMYYHAIIHILPHTTSFSYRFAKKSNATLNDEIEIWLYTFSGQTINSVQYVLFCLKRFYFILHCNLVQFSCMKPRIFVFDRNICYPKTGLRVFRVVFQLHNKTS
jgi:hypothetical protein